MSGVRIGDYVKVRFWPGETIWARVTAFSGGSIDAVLVNDPAPAEIRPPEFAHYASSLKMGDPVSCGADEIIEHRRAEEISD